jgi:hypothetical protein
MTGHRGSTTEASKKYDSLVGLTCTQAQLPVILFSDSAADRRTLG